MSKDRLVFDCNVFLQAILNDEGAGVACLALVLTDKIELFVCQEILEEIEELPRKEIGVESGLTPAQIAAFIDELVEHSTFINAVPIVFTHPIDPDDSIYVNLAIAANAKLIVSNDNHLLNLINPAKPWSRDFRAKFGEVRIFKPADYLQLRRKIEQRPGE
jgi:putative PIN family toxin of toxin-antitoxin system